MNRLCQGDVGSGKTMHHDLQRLLPADLPQRAAGRRGGISHALLRESGRIFK